MSALSGIVVRLRVHRSAEDTSLKHVRTIKNAHFKCAPISRRRAEMAREEMPMIVELDGSGKKARPARRASCL